MWFLSKKRGSATKSANPLETIATIRISIDNADKRTLHLQNKIDKLLVEAKSKNAQGNKRGALYAMKKKKMLQGEIEKLDNVKMTLEMQAMQLETAAHNTETVKVMQSGNNAMKKVRKETGGLDKVDNLMDDMRDEAETAMEISNAIGAPLDPYMMEDDDLLRELEELNDGGTTKVEQQQQSSKKKNAASSFFFSRPNKQQQPVMKTPEPELVAA